MRLNRLKWSREDFRAWCRKTYRAMKVNTVTYQQANPSWLDSLSRRTDTSWSRRGALNCTRMASWSTSTTKSRRALWCSQKAQRPEKLAGPKSRFKFPKSRRTTCFWPKRQENARQSQSSSAATWTTGLRQLTTSAKYRIEKDRDWSD